MKKNKYEIKIAIIGLGYVGLPLAVEFCKKFSVVGFDLNEKRIDELNNNYDRTNEVEENVLIKSKSLIISSEVESIIDANVYIVTVPTPIDANKKPNLNPLKLASKTVGGVLAVNDIVIYESTVFPNCTEEICVPILVKYSKLKYNEEFFCGYSPERINPGDKEHTLTKIKKITSGSDKKTAQFVDELYDCIIEAGTLKVSSIAVAEAAKVIENTQRDVNIALVNELALIFNKMDLDSKEIFDAASTKWNFIPFRPGLVGGHCIGVDPYYLTYKAKDVGYDPKIILAGRRINDAMGNFIADSTIQELVKQGIHPKGAKVAIFGISFKENCPDFRNTKVLSIIDQLRYYKCKIVISDHRVDSMTVKEKLGLDLCRLTEVKNQNAIIVAVSHKEYYNFKQNDWKRMLQSGGVIIDVKSIYDKDTFANKNIRYWRL